MVEWVWRAASASGLMAPVVVATDSDEVAHVCRERGIPVAMTSPDLPQRVRPGARSRPPASTPTSTSTSRATSPPLLPISSRPCSRSSTVPRSRCQPSPFRCPPEEFANPNAVKVVTALDGRALYFSRATIPFDRDRTGFTGYRKHLGIYAYRKAALERFAALPPSPLEKLERLEQLRLLENGIGIYVADAPRDTIGVDTEEDLSRAEAVLKQAETE